MDTDARYRVISRGKAVLLAVPVLIAAAVLIALTAESLENFARGFADVEGLEVNAAIADLTGKLRVLAVAQLFGLLLFCGYIIWYALRAIRTESLPPAGSWIIEGQRTRSGANAVSVAKFLIALAVLLGVAGVIAAVYIWRLALLFAGPASGA